MVLGEYPAQGTNQLISREWISQARTRWDIYVAENGEKSPIGTRAIQGVDVAEFGSDANVLCSRFGGFVEMPVVWSGIDTVSTGDRTSDE
jgi:hypothetical protein